jgi:voltage-gated potassium channel
MYSLHQKKTNRFSLPQISRPLLLTALLLSIPAFYLVLDSESASYQSSGHWLYAVVAIMLGIDLFITTHKYRRGRPEKISQVDVFILLGALFSAWPSALPWPVIEWLLRLAYCVLVFLRMATLLAKYVAPHRLLQIVILALFVLAIAGEGFLLLEPKVHTYADGVWLAFITAATLGYGDFSPSTPASRIFAAFIVFLGYALFSIVTASISAILIGEDEKRLRQELHADTRMLRAEIAALRSELHDKWPIEAKAKAKANAENKQPD